LSEEISRGNYKLSQDYSSAVLSKFVSVTKTPIPRAERRVGLRFYLTAGRGTRSPSRRPFVAPLLKEKSKKDGTQFGRARAAF
jgi:hypothetical protein